MIEIRFPADRRDIAEAMGRALLAIASGETDKRELYQKGPAGAETVQPRSKRSDPTYAEPVEGPVPAADPEAELADATASPEGPESVPYAVECDDHGVPFDPEYCGQAKDPFYGSGPRKGQWKKRKGVDESAYDEWYARAKGVTFTIEAEKPEPPASLFDSAQAFAKPDSAQEPEPATVGELMAWISEKQAARTLTYQDVQDAYARTGVTVQKLFAGSPEEQARDCLAVYRELNR